MERSKPHLAANANPILSQDESDYVIYEVNRTTKQYRDATVVELIDESSRQNPEAIAISFGYQEISYEALRLWSDSIASNLIARGVRPNTTVGLYYHRSLALLPTIIGILKAGAAYLPLEPDLPPARIQQMIEIAAVRFVLHADTVASPTIEGSIEWLAIESSPNPSGWGKPPPPSIGQYAYVIFTSGSTGSPKGVVNTHLGLSNRLQWMQDYFQLSSKDVVLHKTPLGFDVSVWELLWPLSVGAQVVVAEPEVHREPRLIGELIDRKSITTVHFVPAMLHLFLEGLFLGECGSTCSSLKRVICSGEALPVSLARQCLERLNSDLFNLYGPTEASIDVTAWKCEADFTGSTIPIGSPISNMQVYILDDQLRPLPRGSVGEICLAGIGLAEGYIGRPDLTTERFLTVALDSKLRTRIYRTGDLGRLRSDGAYEYLGRLDFQVKINGVRIEVDEIEHVIRKFPGVSACVVVPVKTKESECLVAYIKMAHLSRPTSMSAELLSSHIRSYLLSQVPIALVPEFIVLVSSLPVTNSGKIDRATLIRKGRPVRMKLGQVAPPTTTTEITLVKIWNEVLGNENIGIDDNFFALGGNSLHAVRIVFRVQDQLGCMLSVKAIFDTQTTRKLATLCDNHCANKIRPTGAEVAFSRSSTVPLTLSQNSLWLYSVLNPASIAYNISFSLEIQGVSVARIKNALIRTIQRHAALWSIFSLAEPGPICTFSATTSIDIPLIESDSLAQSSLSKSVSEQIKRLACQPFDLESAVPFRFALFSLPNGDCIVGAAIHHLVFDEWSWNIFVTDLGKHLGGNDGSSSFEPEAVDYSYAVFAVEQRELSRSQKFQESLAYWVNYLSPSSQECVSVAPESSAWSVGGVGINEVHLSAELSAQVVAFAKTSGTTPFTIFMYAFSTILTHLQKKSEILISFPVVGRSSVRFENTIGFFANLIVLKTRPVPSNSIYNEIARMASELNDLYDHTAVPLDMIVAQLSENGWSRIEGLFDFHFSFRIGKMPSIELPKGRLTAHLFEDLSPKFKFKLDVRQLGDTFALKGVYSEDEFSSSQVDFITLGVIEVLERCVNSPALPLSEK